LQTSNIAGRRREGRLTMKSKAHRTARRALGALGVGALVAAVALAGGPAAAQRLGECVRAELGATVLLPDGSHREVETLRLCFDRKMNPIAGLHEVEADGASQFAQSRIGEAEADAAAGAVIVFERNRAGELRLIGYAVPDGDRIVTFALRCVGQRDDDLQAKRGLLDQTEDGRKVRIAAHRSQ